VPTLGGVALYGIESPKNITLNNRQCDGAWSACVFLGSSGVVNADLPSVISNVLQKCSGVQNIWPTYYGVELATGISAVAVSNVVADPTCQIGNTQFVHYDSPILDPSVQTLSQSTSAQFCTPSLGYRNSRYYKTPFSTASPIVVAAGVLYAAPVQVGCTVTVNQLSTYVQTGAAGACHLGIYGNNGKGQPGALVADAVVSVAYSGAPAVSGPLATQLPPGLFFLVLGCNVAPTVKAGLPVGNLVGLAFQNDTSAIVETPWTYAAQLPSFFPTASYAPNAAAPLVFIKPL
jgi:hypothetical protein